ncbi:hypothetical protein SAMN04490248_109108 [Salinihabitans flavidus]|uniref:Uncharacterized protein n=1 Tax=Salinihabitans flavidus TaxID=569882 RepID=A0A1H8RRI7_9RHOB|nr:hypothetical protein [Salinihabitans flavidus]SEO69229.1 hypothetical protein SAMN04490248_109108 [Salinihabitans flavidus]
MTSVWELLAGSITFAWLLARIPGLRGRALLACAMGLVLVAGTALADLQPGGIWIATFEPFGVMLPALCASALAAGAGWIAPPAVSRAEKLIWAALMLVVLLGAGGALPLHPYTWFYAGWESVLLVLCVAVWAFWRRQTLVLGAVALGQLMWLADVGSSNLYDHLAHTLLVPALAVSALWPGRTSGT